MGTESVKEFIRAFNERDLDSFVNQLHPEVEIHGMRGLRRGVEEAREWATRPPGGVQQEILVDEIVHPGSETPGGAGGPTGGDGAVLTDEGDRAAADGDVVALIRRRMYWDEDGTEAGVDVMAWRFRLEDGRVRLWKPYEDRDEALREAGLDR